MKILILLGALSLMLVACGGEEKSYSAKLSDSPFYNPAIKAEGCPQLMKDGEVVALQDTLGELLPAIKGENLMVAVRYRSVIYRPTEAITQKFKEYNPTEKIKEKLERFERIDLEKQIIYGRPVPHNVSHDNEIMNLRVTYKWLNTKLLLEGVQPDIDEKLKVVDACQLLGELQNGKLKIAVGSRVFSEINGFAGDTASSGHCGYRVFTVYKQLLPPSFTEEGIYQDDGGFGAELYDLYVIQRDCGGLYTDLQESFAQGNPKKYLYIHDFWTTDRVMELTTENIKDTAAKLEAKMKNLL